MVGAAAYWGVLRLTGYEIGLLAIGVGLLVGFAVRLGSQAWGGLGFQALAMLLTYLAIVATYGPTVANELRRSVTPSSELAAASAKVPSAEAGDNRDRGTAEKGTAQKGTEESGALRSLRALGLFALLVLAVPVMGGGGAGAGGWLFLILALLQAAILNRSGSEVSAKSRRGGTENGGRSTDKRSTNKKGKRARGKNRP
jgi:hypothetical protein